MDRHNKEESFLREIISLNRKWAFSKEAEATYDRSVEALALDRGLLK